MRKNLVAWIQSWHWGQLAVFWIAALLILMLLEPLGDAIEGIVIQEESYVYPQEVQDLAQESESVEEQFAKALREKLKEQGVYPSRIEKPRKYMRDLFIYKLLVVGVPVLIVGGVFMTTWIWFGGRRENGK